MWATGARGVPTWALPCQTTLVSLLHVVKPDPLKPTTEPDSVGPTVTTLTTVRMSPLVLMVVPLVLISQNPIRPSAPPDTRVRLLAMARLVTDLVWPCGDQQGGSR